MEGACIVDIIVLGATGFMGRLITDVLRTHRERPSFTFGLAARSQRKLESLKEDLQLEKSVQTFEFDVNNQQQVEDVVSQAAVIINTVGPYWNWGTAVVKACLKLGRHYVDLTGESYWVRDIITECDYLATLKGCTIIPSCGLDSLPSDVVVFLANKTLKALAGPDTDIDISTSAVRLNSTISSGTVRTMISYLEDVPPFITTRSRGDFYLSNVPGVPNPPMRLTYRLPLSNPPIQGAMSLMAGANRSLVQRSWGLHEYDMRKSIANRTVEKRMLTYGPQFKYDEFLATPTKTSAVLTSMAFVFAALCLWFPPTRWIVKRMLPSWPEAPSEDLRKNGFLEITNVTSSTSTPTRSPVHVRTVLYGKGEAGYYLSAYMITECALGLLFSRDELPSLGREGGVLTPTTALGDVLIRRLEDSGKFSFHSEVILSADESRKAR